MLEVHKLCFAFRQREVFANVSFRAEPGELLAVLGPNGAGKSTLFRCILGFVGGYEGTVRVNGVDTRKISPRKLAALLAYIPQGHRPAFGYTALDMVLMGVTHELPLLASPRARQVERAREAMARVGIEALADRDFTRLSGGEQQLVLIARGLAQRSGILIMDEPTASLDYGNQIRVLQRVRELAEEGYTVLLSTHNPQHALTFSHRVLALSHGRVAALGTAQEALTKELIRTLYGVEAHFLQTPQGTVIVSAGEVRQP